MSKRQAINWNAIKARIGESQAAIEQSLVAVEGKQLAHVYRDRARQFATRSAVALEPSGAWPALAFTVGRERFCLAISAVAEVLRYARCAPIPGAQAVLLGVINVRGHVCSVLDLAGILELPEGGDRSRGYIVLFRHGGVEVGLRVDEVEQIETVSPGELAAPGGDLAVLSPQYVHGRTAGRIAVLDVEAVFSHPIFRVGHETGIRPSSGLNVAGHTSPDANAQTRVPTLFGGLPV